MMTGCGERTASLDALREREVVLPSGKKIRAEVMMTPQEMQRGMMFRDSLPQGRGMLFIHNRPGNYRYWMYQVRIPLDIIWMDANRRVVEISADTPPCKTPASQCPNYGGNEVAQYVLELAGGEARRLGIQVGNILKF
jgi:uncharacterized membrane protein (UPF0127 family)